MAMTITVFDHDDNPIATRNVDTDDIDEAAGIAGKMVFLEFGEDTAYAAQVRDRFGFIVGQYTTDM